MNWQAISAISEFVSSIAVVASLLYLAIQVHRSTRVANVAAQDAAATALRDVTTPIMANAELGRIWQVGLEDFEALSNEDRARFFHAAYQFLKAFETIHFHYAARVMDRQLWEGWRELLRHYCASPGIMHYWNLRHYLFSKRFQEFVQSLDRPTDRFTVGSLLEKEEKLQR
jgi:hypothetical protein